MSKLVVGFVLGVIATLAAVYFLGGKAPHLLVEEPERSTASEDPISAPRARTPADLNEARDQHGHSFSEQALVDSESEPDSLVPGADPTVLPQQNTNTLSLGQESSSETRQPEYPPEISEMIENRVNKELQARYENDRREESWATYMEGQLAGYFSQKTVLSQFNFSLIDCRTSVCSVHVLGYGPDALTHWNTATADLVSQPWFEFNNMSMDRRNPAPDILAVVLILTKKPAS